MKNQENNKRFLANAGVKILISVLTVALAVSVGLNAHQSKMAGNLITENARITNRAAVLDNANESLRGQVHDSADEINSLMATNEYLRGDISRLNNRIRILETSPELTWADVARLNIERELIEEAGLDPEEAKYLASRGVGLNDVLNLQEDTRIQEHNRQALREMFGYVNKSDDWFRETGHETAFDHIVSNLILSDEELDHLRTIHRMLISHNMNTELPGMRLYGSDIDQLIQDALYPRSRLEIYDLTRPNDVYNTNWNRYENLVRDFVRLMEIAALLDMPNSPGLKAITVVYEEEGQRLNETYYRMANRYQGSSRQYE